MWPEVSIAKNEKRRELVLGGNEISKRISENGLDDNIFMLNDLNYLNIHETKLSNVPCNISKLTNLTNLVLHSNKIEKVHEKITELNKLKVLDLSRNQIDALPESLPKLTQIVTLNFSNNVLENFPRLSNNSKLSVLDLSNNKLTKFPDICYEELTNLSELKLNNNRIEDIPDSIHVLPALKSFDISANLIKNLPGELADCHKLKEINLTSNPISDKRLLKLIQQCRTKQIIDYVKQHCPKSATSENSVTKKSGKNKKHQKTTESDEENIDYKYNITVKKASDDFKVIIQNSVKGIREHIVCCLVNNIKFTEETFKKFIQFQNKLHDTICDKRNAATVATHDFAKFPVGNITYTTSSPSELMIKPLNRPNLMSGAELFLKLQTEANNLRKEKKRNTYSGIHKYLYLIEGKPTFPCLINSKNEVISFPPITNSDISKIEVGTTKIFIEVTSGNSQLICKSVLNEILKEMVILFEDLEVQQVKCVDSEDHLKIVFPSKTDLNYDTKDAIKVDQN